MTHEKRSEIVCEMIRSYAAMENDGDASFADLIICNPQTWQHT